jgi:hypothetical protein
MGSIATTTRATIATAVAPAATYTIPAYPSGTTQASLTGTTGGSMRLNNNDVFPQAASGAGTVAYTFNASTITVTNNTGVTWAVGDIVQFGFGNVPYNGSYNLVIGTQYNQAKAGNL